MRDSFAALILAAGNSSRLGQPKQLLTVGGQTLVDRMIAAARGAGCEPVVVVTGAIILPPRPDVWLIANPRWSEGMGTSIRAGLSAVLANGGAPAAFVILLCDQPHVSAEILCALIEQFRRTEKPIVASRYAGSVGVPALFGPEIYQELQQLPPAAGAKKILEADPERVATIDFPDGAIDIDTPADLAALPKS